GERNTSYGCRALVAQDSTLPITVGEARGGPAQGKFGVRETAQSRCYRGAVVRRDDDGSPAGDPGENPSSRCGDPAGASPASVSGNAPSSRLPARGRPRRPKRSVE